MSATDLVALHRAVLIDPADDAVRLVYADCLEECGRSEWAQFIRWQVRGNFPGAWCLTAGAEGDPGFGCVIANPYPFEVRYRRGFVKEVRGTLADFMRHAESLFDEYPITEVVLTDRAPARDINGWNWTTPSGIPLRARLTYELWRALPAGYPATPGSTEARWRYYLSEDEALLALSRACVAHGRTQAGLPPLS